MLALVALLGVLTPGFLPIQAATSPPPPQGTRPAAVAAPALGAVPPEVCALEEFASAPQGGSGAMDEWAERLGPIAADYELESLIALVPHPARSRLPAAFDQHVQSIQRALEDAGYLLDHHELPWNPAAPGAERDGGAAPTSSPRTPCDGRESSRGLLLFRDAQPGRKTRLLSVLLVPETPSAGIDKPALYGALDFVLAAQAVGPPAAAEPMTFRILGPTFSGSATSLKRAIVLWSQAHLAVGSRRFKFDVVSGSATNAESGRAIAERQDYPAGLQDRLDVSFRTTVYSDDYLMRLFFHYLQNRDAAVPGRACPTSIDDSHAPEILEKVALLVEANTEYGEGVSAAATRGAGGYLKLPFPMHIAQVRAERSKAAASVRKPAAEPVVDFRLQPLDLPDEDTVGGGDVVPPFARLSSRADDLVLGNLLAAVSPVEVQYVGIVATDVMDRLFLAQAVRKHLPDVTLIAFSGDLLYTHPRYARELEGMLVASTYPLFTQNQIWTWPHRGSRKRIQFPTMEAEGVFNAALALLRREDLMLDYGVPLEEEGAEPHEARPPVWISAVGRGALWPVAAVCRMDKPDPLLLGIQQHPHGAGGQERGETHAKTISTTTFFKVYAVGFVLIAVLHASAYLVISGRRRAWPVLWRLFPMFATTREGSGFLVQRLFVFACFVILSLVYAWITVPPLLRLIADWDPSLGLFLEGVVLLAGWVALYTPIVRIVRAIRRAAPPSRSGRLLAGGVVTLALLPVALLLATVTYAFGSPVHVVRADPMERAWLAAFYLRASNLSSGLSPLLPMLFMGFALYLWSLAELRRLRFGEGARHLDAVCRLGGVGVEGLPVLMGRVDSLLGDNLYTLRACAGLFAALIILFWLSLKRLPASVDGRYFVDLFEGLLFLVVTAVVFELCRFFLVWRTLQRMLRRFAWHRVKGGFQRLPKVISSAPLLDLKRAGATLATMRASVDHWQALIAAGRASSEDPLVEPPPTWKAFARESEPRAAEAAADVQTAIDDEAFRTWDLEGTQWRLQERVNAETAQVIALLEGSGRAPAACTEAAEDFLALSVLSYVRYVVAQMRNLLLFVTSAVLLVLLAISSYPFQPRHLLLSLSWVVILSMVGTVVLVFVQMDRDEVLSLLADTTPGRVTLGPLLMKLGAYVVIPLLGLVAAQFPEVGRFLFFWVEPFVAAFK